MNIIEKLSAAGRIAAGWLPDGLMVGGVCGISYGTALVYTPAGYIVAGAFALAGGVILARGGK